MTDLDDMFHDPEASADAPPPSSAKHVGFEEPSGDLELPRMSSGDAASHEQVELVEANRRTSGSAHPTYQHASVVDENFKSFVDPQEPRPDLTFYQNDDLFKRPSFRDLQWKVEQVDAVRQHSTLGDLAEETGEESSQSASGAFDTLPDGPNPSAADPSTTGKFGTWDGVFTSVCLNVFGVIMFLRLGWVVGQAGIGLAVVIILLSATVTSLTTLSMSAICTNGEVKAGGAYYLISRSLGPSIGGAVGVVFSIGNAISVALYVIGFCEVLVEQMGESRSLTGDPINDIRVYGVMLTALLFLMAVIGVGWIIKLQMGLFALLILAILSFVVGCFVTEDDGEGVPGIASGAVNDNAGPDFTPDDGIDYDFFTVFAVFFPAVTGVMAGANISGDLKNPSVSIPKGTLTAVGISTFVYVGMAVLVGAAAARGSVAAEKGLLGDSLIMIKTALSGEVVAAGVYCATFSSAMAALIGAPRILQSVAHDNLIPSLRQFARVRARDGSPMRGTLATFVLASLCVLIGKLNLIAPLISMFFMVTYALINFACFALSHSKSPGWRPTFRFYSRWSALAGGLLCTVCMFLIDWIYAVSSIAVGVGIYKYVEYRNPDVNWGSAIEARREVEAMRAVLALRQSKRHVKTFRPSYLVLTGYPDKRLHLVRFVDSLSKGHGITVYGSVTVGDYRRNIVDFRATYKEGYYQNPELGINGFLDAVIASDVRQGAQALVQLAGIGRLRPNTVALGYKEDWLDVDAEQTEQYVNIIRDSFKMRMGVMMLRGVEFIDWDEPARDKYIDVWWLIDDGGLAILVPHILTLHHYWQARGGGDRVRLFVVVEHAASMRGDFQMVANMLAKFRLDWEPVLVETGGKPASPDSESAYESFAPNSIDEQPRPQVTRRWLRASELIHERSHDSRLVIVTMPFPRDAHSALDWMSWCEMLSRGMPPTVLIRGNGRSCLTFYSE